MQLGNALLSGPTLLNGALKLTQASSGLVAFALHLDKLGLERIAFSFERRVIGLGLAPRGNKSIRGMERKIAPTPARGERRAVCSRSSLALSIASAIRRTSGDGTYSPVLIASTIKSR
jgi:hypothetical protein